MEEQLPFVDRYGIVIDAERDVVWNSLTEALPRLMGPGHFEAYARLIGTSDRKVDWNEGSAGSTLVGFHVTRSERPERLELEGSHRFSRYQLIWTIDEVAPRQSHLQAETRAAFPGLHGRAYRAMVIGSGAHARILKRVLASISRQASGG